MPHFISKLIRKYLVKNPERMCDKCLEQFTNLSRDGKKYCDNCFKEMLGTKIER